MSNMTLDKAIEHCREVAEEQMGRSDDPHSVCHKCAKDHLQLAKWLEELKVYRYNESNGGLVEALMHSEADNERLHDELKAYRVSRKELLNDIDMAIKAANMDDAYSVGMRNGMRVIKAFIDDEEPQYEKCCHEESRSETPNTCGDAISRVEAYAVVDRMLMGDRNHKIIALEEIQKLPSVTPQQRTGRWIEYVEPDDAEPLVLWRCENCDTVERRKTLYCPCCGAKMEVEECYMH